VRYAVFGGTFFAVVMILAYGLYPKAFPAASTPPRYGICALVFLLLPLLYRYLPARLMEGSIQGAEAWGALKHAARAAMTKRTALLLAQLLVIGLSLHFAVNHPYQTTGHTLQERG